MMPRRKVAGHSLAELMAALTVVGVLLTGLATFVGGTAGSAVEGWRYAEDLRAMRIGLERVARLVRTADHVQTADDRLTLTRGRSTQTLVVDDGTLRLDDRVLVSGLGSARFEQEDDGVVFVVAPPSRGRVAPPQLRRLISPRTQVAR